ncbi:hypothetical protein CEXT_614841 [Caerostris extrusa]|uniref:Uncharacterized protein n=1 Tax=Caerostris extrusa TaxID=172846 RepID=A0AAV4WBR6_CAEEX|nr:hypothetical protein CEXT_614841 [Caerostris extrusa]
MPKFSMPYELSLFKIGGACVPLDKPNWVTPRLGRSSSWVTVTAFCPRVLEKENHEKEEGKRYVPPNHSDHVRFRELDHLSRRFAIFQVSRVGTERAP